MKALGQFGEGQSHDFAHTQTAFIRLLSLSARYQSGQVLSMTPPRLAEHVMHRLFNPVNAQLQCVHLNIQPNSLGPGLSDWFSTAKVLT